MVSIAARFENHCLKSLNQLSVQAMPALVSGNDYNDASDGVDQS